MRASVKRVTTCETCHGEGYLDRRCLHCGSGQCVYCLDWSCLRDEGSRSGNFRHGGVESWYCGKYLRAGDYVGKFREQAYCSKCVERLVGEGFPKENFELGYLAGCVPCGYRAGALYERN